MLKMICRNKVKNFRRWKAVFDADRPAHREAGLTLRHSWRAIDDPNTIIFIFAVASLRKAKAFISTPDAKETGRKAGVVEGDYWFVK